MADLICLGEALFEFSNTGQGKWLSGVGGDVSNVAIAAARQGASVAMLTQLGNDTFGKAIRNVWRAEGVDDSSVATHETAPTGLYFITHEGGEHHFEYRRTGSAAALMRPADLPESAMDGARILHLSGISQAISDDACDTAATAIKQMQQNGGKVCYDPNLRLKLWPLERARQVIHETIAQADIVLPGYDDARMLTGLERPEDILERYRNLGAGIVAMTMGDNGAIVSFGNQIQHIPAPRAKAVDATGAGDSFDGAFLSQLIDGRSVPEAATYGVAAASLAVTGYGATNPIPNRDAVLATHPFDGAKIPSPTDRPVQ